MAFLELSVVRLHNASVVIFSVVCGGVIVEGGGDGGVMSGVLSCVGGSVIWECVVVCWWQCNEWCVV